MQTHYGVGADMETCWHVLTAHNPPAHRRSQLWTSRHRRDEEVPTGCMCSAEISLLTGYCVLEYPLLAGYVVLQYCYWLEMLDCNIATGWICCTAILLLAGYGLLEYPY
jgi:hypothetical protein